MFSVKIFMSRGDMLDSQYNIPMLRDACVLHPGVLDINRSDQVEHLDRIFSQDDVTGFFSRTHVTSGMSDFIRGALRRLSGNSSQAIFELKQAMGGGKTHNLIALGLVASRTELLEFLPESISEGLDVPVSKVVAINGRDISDTEQLWGEIATKLGKGESFRKFWIDGPKKVNESDWLQLLGDDPVVILLDELPPYMAQAHTQTVGKGTLLDVLKYNLANLLSAAMKSPRSVVVMASLDAAYGEARKELGALLKDLQQETRRGAKSITPVDLSSGEIYEILRKRIFASLPDEAVIERIAKAYSGALEESVRGTTLRKGSEALADEIAESYPFHPRYKTILALFKENEKFRQTRGLIEFTINLVRGVWSNDWEVFLLGAEHADFSDMAMRDQVRDIERSLESALASDVFDMSGSAHAQQIDAERDTDMAGRVSALLFVSSLSDNTDGVRGLSREHIAETLTGPGIPASRVIEAFDTLRERCWYMHSRDGDRWYFSDIANVRKQIEDKVSRVDQARVDQVIKDHIEKIFKPTLKTAYQDLLVLPEIREIKLSPGKRVCLVLHPDAQNPPETAARFFGDQIHKNAFCIISGDGTRMGNLGDIARRLVAIEQVAAIVSETPRHKEEIESERNQATTQFLSATLALFNSVWYPQHHKDGARLNPILLDFTPHTDKGRTDGEASVVAALASAKKMLSADPEQLESLRLRAEDVLFPTGQSRARWSDIQERAASNPRWVWLPPKGLESIKIHALSTGRWAEADGYVDKAPPPPQPVLTIEGTRFDPRTGKSEIDLMVANAGRAPTVLVSETPDVYDSGSPIEGLIVRTEALELWFGLIHEDGQQRSEIRSWTGKITLTHERQVVGDTYLVSLNAKPEAEIRWNITGINEKDGAVYTPGEKITLSGNDRTTVFVYAKKGGVEAREKFTFDPIGIAREIDDALPAEVTMDLQFPDMTAITRALVAAKSETGTLFTGFRLTVGSGDASLALRSGGSVQISPEEIETMISELRRISGDKDASVSLRADGMRFLSGHALKSFAEKSGIDIPADKVVQ